MHKIRVLYITSTLQDSGPINVLKNIILYLDRNLFEPVILTLSPESNDSRKKFFEEILKVKVISFNLSRITGLMITKKDIDNIVKNQHIDLIHSHCLRADIIASKVKCIPTLSTLHNHPFLDYGMSFGKIKGFLAAYIHINSIKKISYPISCSKNISKQLNLAYNLNLHYVQNGVDIDEFLPKDKNTDNITFISIGGLTVRKDPLTIIKAFKLLNNNKYKLIFLGDGPLKEICVKEARGLNIEFAGFQKEIKTFVERSDYFISSSLSEGLPNSVLEAMSYGLPCILSDIPSHNEFYDNAETKFVFKPKQHEQLASLLKHIQTFDYKKLSEEQMLIIKLNFTAKIMSDKYQEYYKKALEL